MSVYITSEHTNCNTVGYATDNITFLQTGKMVVFQRFMHVTAQQPVVDGRVTLVELVAPGNGNQDQKWGEV